MLRGTMYGMFWCLLMTIGVASISPQAKGSNTCVFISTIESQEHKKLHAMNSTQCTTSDFQLPSTNCKWKSKKNGDVHVSVKLECFCAGKTNDQSIECEPSDVKLCCNHDNVVCLNGGKLTESNCSAKPKPLYKCECPTVLDGRVTYQGERCEKIPVIRECVYKDSVNVNDSLKSCYGETVVSRACIHRVNDTAYECGPAHQNVDGMVNKKCERRYNTMAPTKGAVSVTPESNSGENTDYHKVSLVFFPIVAVIITVQ